MATLFHQTHQKNSSGNSNGTTTTSVAGNGPNNGVAVNVATTGQGPLTIKKLANGSTVLVGAPGTTPTTLHPANGQLLTTATTTTAFNGAHHLQANHHNMQQNHAQGTTIILTASDHHQAVGGGYTLPSKFVLPSTLAAAGGTIIQQQQQQHSQIIQLGPNQQLAAGGANGAYQIVQTAGGHLNQVYHHQPQQQATVANTLTKVPTTTMMMAAANNGNHHPKIISISNATTTTADGTTVIPTTTTNASTPLQIINGHHQPQQQQPTTIQGGQLLGNILRIVPQGTLSGAGGVAGGATGTPQVIQVMGADGRLMTLTGFKKASPMIVATTQGSQVLGGRIVAGQQLQPNNGTLNNNNGGNKPIQVTAVGTGAPQQVVLNRQNQIVSTVNTRRTPAGTIIIDKAPALAAANRISTTTAVTAAGGGAAVVLGQQQQQPHLSQHTNNTTVVVQSQQQQQPSNLLIGNNRSSNNQVGQIHPHQNHPHLSTTTATAATHQTHHAAAVTATAHTPSSVINGGKAQHPHQQQQQLPDEPEELIEVPEEEQEEAVEEKVTEEKTAAETGTTATTEAEAAAAGPENPVDASAAAAPAAEEEGDEPEIDIVINNVVCSFSVRCHLNLREIALNGHNVEFRRENGMVTMKLRKPYTTASMWSSGKITCTGATSEDQAKVAARRYARCLQKLDFKTRLHNFRIVNVLGTCHMPWDIKITNFSERHRQDASYEPELHPGVTYKLKSPKATLKIFSTGSVTVTAASVAYVQEAIEYIFPLLYEFRKERPKEVVPIVPDDDLDTTSDEDVYGMDSDDNIMPDGRLKEDSFWSDEDENGKSVAGRSYLTGGRKRKGTGSSGGGGKAATVPKKVGKFARSSRPHRRRRPLGKAANDPGEDVMDVSDLDDF